MNMCLLDRNFQVLPKSASQGSVAIEPFGKRLRCPNENLDTRCDSGEKLTLCTIQVNGSYQYHIVTTMFVGVVTYLAMLKRETACGLNVP